MDYKDIDHLLKVTLSPSECPSQELNNRILSRMKESNEMKIRNKRHVLAVCIVTLCLFIIPASVYAAYKYLSPKEAAIKMGDSKLGGAFDEKGAEVLETVTDGRYKVTYLGHVTGEGISERTGSAWDMNPERTYVAVAIESTDGTPISYDDSFFVSPLIKGLEPWLYNIASMNGSYIAEIIDGVLYRIIECDNVEIFADRQLYLAVSDTNFFSNEAFAYDLDSGEISIEEGYAGTNLLFDLKLDPSKADEVKVKDYLEQLDKAWQE